MEKMKFRAFFMIYMVIFWGCGTKNNDIDKVFDLDGFEFGWSYSKTLRNIEKRNFVLVDRVEFSPDKELDKSMYPIADLMLVYQAELFNRPMEVAFHFKKNQFKFLVLQIRSVDIDFIIDRFSLNYGTPFMHGEEYDDGEIFEGDNILWLVYDQHQNRIGYVSLMPTGFKNEDFDFEEWGAIVSIYPLSADPLV